MTQSAKDGRGNQQPDGEDASHLRTRAEKVGEPREALLEDVEDARFLAGDLTLHGLDEGGGKERR